MPPHAPSPLQPTGAVIPHMLVPLEPQPPPLLQLPLTATEEPIPVPLEVLLLPQPSFALDAPQPLASTSLLELVWPLFQTAMLIPQLVFAHKELLDITFLQPPSEL